MADKVQGTALIGVFRQLGGHLLHPVFAQGVDPGGNGLLAGGGVVHFAGAHQDNVGAGAPRFPGRLVHLLPDGGNILRNRHSESLPFRGQSSFNICVPSRVTPVMMTSSPGRSVDSPSVF